MCVDCFRIVSPFLPNPRDPSTLSKEAFVYFVCPTEIPQPPFAWKYYFVHVHLHSHPAPQCTNHPAHPSDVRVCVCACACVSVRLCAAECVSSSV